MKCKACREARSVEQESKELDSSIPYGDTGEIKVNALLREAKHLRDYHCTCGEEAKTWRDKLTDFCLESLPWILVIAALWGIVILLGYHL